MIGRTIAALALTALSLALASPAVGQQVADTTFRPAQGAPAYPDRSGPEVLIDEGHHNFHTLGGRFAPFAGLIGRDGFRTGSLRGALTRTSLDSADILVIANPLAFENTTRWTLPTPSAFTAPEIDALHDWVERGGALLLIADHMPFGGAAHALAARFGVRFANGFVMDSSHASGIIRFRKADGTLMAVPTPTGTASVPVIDSVIGFTGQAFQLERPGIPLLRIPAGWHQFLPSEAWQFDPDTPRQPAEGLLQGALMTVGKGRLAIFGEAAMFTAQLAGPARSPAGFNHPAASENAQFVLNVMHWLAERASR